MKIVVDSNIVFSAILNTKGNIGQIITIGARHFEFFTIDLLIAEIFKHQNKILKISGYSKEKFHEIFKLMMAYISTIDEKQISDENIKNAYRLSKDIDEKDTMFVALTNHLDASLWTGDKKLETGLKNKNYDKVINTPQLYDMFVQRELLKPRKI